MAAAVASSSWPVEPVHSRHTAASHAVAATSRPASTASAAATSTRSSQHASPAPKKSTATESHDRFYGHRDVAELCERVILALFACPLDSASSSVGAAAPAGKPAPRLSEFIAYALHRTRLPLAVTHQALFLLKRLKSRFPAARGSSGHRLFISALMLASKSSCDDTYSNKSWTIVGQGLFSLREVNQMERELFGYLGFRVNVEPEDLDDFVVGLEHGRIHAPVEPISPEMGSSSQFEDQQAEAAVNAPYTPPRSPLSKAPAVSPSAMSEPCFSTQQSGAHLSTRPRPHESTTGAFNTRASIAGYPSLSSQPMVHSRAVPMAASSSDSSYHPSPFHQPHSRSSTVPSQAPTLCVPGPTPTVCMAPFYPGSPSSVSLSSSRGSISYGSAMSSCSYPTTSPYASGASSSNGTTPATPNSDFVASPNHSWPSEGIDSYAMSKEQPAGTYDSEHSLYTAKRSHCHPFPTQDTLKAARRLQRAVGVRSDQHSMLSARKWSS
ncbi:unnamed protein product [Parajaminaea phylloscopi]